jgi:ABC-type nitrate/sulfonate/bicarbonate transport system substrate-binding protein
MTGFSLDAGFLPLVDSALLVVAHEMGFDAKEGFQLRLRRENLWSTIRDKLALRRLDAAHMQAPAPVAMSMGLGGLPQKINALMVLSVNGNSVGVSNDLAARMHAAGPRLGFMEARGIGERLICAAAAPIRVEVPFSFSLHAGLL